MREPQTRQITSWQEAELNALEWMRAAGFADARLTAAGADEGLDIRSSTAVAQVKYEARDVGRPHLQRLVGARGRRIDLQLLFFTGARYTDQAVAYANGMDIALFQYGLDGRVQPVNAAAVSLVKRTGGRSRAGAGADPYKFGPWVLTADAAAFAIAGPGWPVFVVWVFSILFMIYVSVKSRS